jgi:hypothetical protein
VTSPWPVPRDLVPFGTRRSLGRMSGGVPALGTIAVAVSGEDADDPVSRSTAHRRLVTALEGCPRQVSSEMPGHATTTLTLNTYSHLIPAMARRSRRDGSGFLCLVAEA